VHLEVTEGNYSNVGHRGPVYKGLGAMNPCDNLTVPEVDEKQCYIFSVCVYSRRYPVVEAYAPIYIATQFDTLVKLANIKCPENQSNGGRCVGVRKEGPTWRS
jgi:hypothetical protein